MRVDKVILHQLFMHLLLLLHLLAGHTDLVMQRLDLRQLPGRLQLDEDQTGSTQVSVCWDWLSWGSGAESRRLDHLRLGWCTEL